MSLEDHANVVESLAAELDEQPSAWQRRMQRRKNRDRAGTKQSQQEHCREPDQREAEVKKEEVKDIKEVKAEENENHVSSLERQASTLPVSTETERETPCAMSSLAPDGTPGKSQEEGKEQETDEETAPADKMRAAIKALKERRVQLAAAEDDNEELRAENEALNEQLQDVRAELEAERDGRQRAHDDMAAQKASLDQAQASKSSLAAEFEAVRAQLATSTSSLRDSHAKVSSLELELGKLRTELGAMRGQLAKQAKNGSVDEEATKNLQAELETSRAELEHAKARNDKLVMDGKELRRSIAELVNGTKFLQQNLDRTREEFEELKASHKLKEEQSAAMKAERDEIRKQKASLLDDAKVNKTQLSVARQELEEARARHKEYTLAAGSKLEELRKLKAAMADARAEFDANGGLWAEKPALDRLRIALEAAGVRADAGAGNPVTPSGGATPSHSHSRSTGDATQRRSLKRSGATSQVDIEGDADAGERPASSIELKPARRRNSDTVAAEASVEVAEGAAEAGEDERPSKVHRRERIGERRSTEDKAAERHARHERKERTEKKKVELRERKDKGELA